MKKRKKKNEGQEEEKKTNTGEKPWARPRTAQRSTVPGVGNATGFILVY